MSAGNTSKAGLLPSLVSCDFWAERVRTAEDDYGISAFEWTMREGIGRDKQIVTRNVSNGYIF